MLAVVAVDGVDFSVEVADDDELEIGDVGVEKAPIEVSRSESNVITGCATSGIEPFNLIGSLQVFARFAGCWNDGIIFVCVLVVISVRSKLLCEISYQKARMQLASERKSASELT